MRGMVIYPALEPRHGLPPKTALSSCVDLRRFLDLTLQQRQLQPINFLKRPGRTKPKEAASVTRILGPFLLLKPHPWPLAVGEIRRHVWGVVRRWARDRTAEVMPMPSQTSLPRLGLRFHFLSWKGRSWPLSGTSSRVVNSRALTSSTSEVSGGNRTGSPAQSRSAFPRLVGSPSSRRFATSGESSTCFPRLREGSSRSGYKVIGGRSGPSSRQRARYTEQTHTMKTSPNCNGEKTCPDCNGDGVVDKDTDDERQCPTCGGLGFVRDDDRDYEQVIKTRAVCHVAKMLRLTRLGA